MNGKRPTAEQDNSKQPRGNGPELTKYRMAPKTIEILEKQGIKTLFPIQQETFDLVYDGKDIMGRDLTGSGKTLAYCLPLIERMRQQKVIEVGKRRSDRAPLVMIVVPTRELVVQVNLVLESLKYSPDEYQVQTVYGGASIDQQVDGLRRGVEIVAGTTGRLLDHLERGNVQVQSLQCVVLDEADRMLDMGFQEDVEKIFEYIRGTRSSNGSSLPVKHSSPQCVLFSATFPSWVQRVAGKYLDPAFTLIDLVKNLKNKTASSVKHLAVFSPYVNRTSILADIILCYGGTFGKTIVFTQTKADANDLYLSEKLKDIEVLHGDIPQQQREITFRGFKEGRFHILVATDVASRGLDIPDVDLIVQCEPPKDVETYIHRSGRTARAGKGGTVVTFYAKKHAPLISRIENMAGITFTRIGAPQPEDIIRASSKFIVEGLKKVTDDALPLFGETADLLVKEFGEKKALLLTLAYISGNLNKLKKRSLLSGTEDFVTYQLDMDKEFRTVSYVWGILRRLLSPDEAEQVRQMRCYKNFKGAAFDVPEKLIPKFEAAYEQEKEKLKYMSYVIKKATELPDLKDFEPLPGAGFENRGGFHSGFRSGYGSNSGSGYGSNSGSGYGSNSGSGYGFRQSGFGGNSRFGAPRDNFHNGGDHTADHYHAAVPSHHEHGHSRSKSRSRSPPRAPARNGFSKAGDSNGFANGNRGANGASRAPNPNEIFMWGVKTEDDVKELLADNHIGWKRVKVLMDDKGESKMVSFVTVDDDKVDATLKLNGTKVNGRAIRVNLASDKPRK